MEFNLVEYLLKTSRREELNTINLQNKKLNQEAYYS